MKFLWPPYPNPIGVAVVVVVVAIVLALYSCAGDDARAVEPEISTKYKDQTVGLDRKALDTAYQNQMVHLFNVWMKDETGQPARFITGANQARRAYAEATTRIEQREQK